VTVKGREKGTDAENSTTRIPLSHTPSRPLSYSYGLIYIPSPFLKNYPFPISLITSPCLAQARILIDFICAHVSETVAKTGVGGRKWKAWIYRRRKGEKKRRCSSRNEPTCFLCFVLTSL